MVYLQNHKFLLWFRIVILSFILGIILFSRFFNFNKARDYWIDRDISFQGIIIKSSVEIEDKKYLAVRPLENKLKDLVLVPVNFYFDFNKGDRVWVSGKLGVNNYNPFDVFLNNKLIYVVNDVKIQMAQESGTVDWFFNLHNFFVGWVKRMFSPREAFLANMFIFGKGGGYSREIDDLFRNAGVSHILVVSGMQLTMFIDILNYIGFILSLGLSFFIFSSISFVVVFILLVGFSASMLRAGVMVFLQVISKLNHRIYNMTNALLLSAFVILLINHTTLFVDLSFQLTFLSIMSLVYISPVITDLFSLRFSDERYKNWIMAISVVLGVFIGMAPFLIYKMNNLSLVSPLANLIVVPLVAPALSLVSFVLILNILGAKIFWIFNILVEWYLKFVLFIVGVFASGKYATYPLSGLSFFWLIFYYSFLIIYLIRYYRRHKYLNLNF